jgi:cell division protein FtsI/penicillin-binding protein 2
MKMAQWKIVLIYLGVMSVGIVAVIHLIALRVKMNPFYTGEKVSADSIVIVEGRSFKLKPETIQGKRGNIFASDSKTLLLSTVYVYDLYWMPSLIQDTADATLFLQKLDSLSIILHQINPSKERQVYKDTLLQTFRHYTKVLQQSKNQNDKLRQEAKKILGKLKNQKIIIRISNLSKSGKWVRNRDIAKIDTLFKAWKGNEKYRGGFLKDKRSIRRQLKGGYPRSILGQYATRKVRHGKDTIFFNRGIEGYYDSLLVGSRNISHKLQVNDYSIRLAEQIGITPEDGCDVITTINTDIQRMAKFALETELLKCQAKWGCVIVMDVKSGEIKAIVNLDKYGTIYQDAGEHAICEAHEPGSTFKLLTLLAVLEKQQNPDTAIRVACERGMFSLKHAFAISDNKGMFEAAVKEYSNIPAFAKGLLDMPLSINLKMEIAGAKRLNMESLLNNKKGSDYESLTHGYAVNVPPIYMLAYYNAIANAGVYVKPRLVKSIIYPNKKVIEMQLEILSKRFCSKRTVELAQGCLESVVSEGTGQKCLSEIEIRHRHKPDFKPLIAGKTGTAFVYLSAEGKYSEKLKNSSFIGYFPTYDPQYSCLVLISETEKAASEVAVPVFMEIAKKLVSYSEYMSSLNKKKDPIDYLPANTFGYQKDLKLIYRELGVDFTSVPRCDFVTMGKDNSQINLTSCDMQGKNWRDWLIGASAKDAVYILEKKGYQTNVKECGKVKRILFDGKKATVILNND